MAKNITNKNNPRNPQSLLFRRLLDFIRASTNYRTGTNHRFVESIDHTHQIYFCKGRDFKRQHIILMIIYKHKLWLVKLEQRYVDFDQMRYPRDCFSHGYIC